MLVPNHVREEDKGAEKVTTKKRDRKLIALTRKITFFYGLNEERAKHYGAWADVEDRIDERELS